MNFAMVINVYIDVDENRSNPFDHPTRLERFAQENTLRATVESINGLHMDGNDRLRVYIIGTATQQSREHDDEIRNEIKNCFSDCPHELLIFTNSDIQSLRDSSGSRLISARGYPELRNVGFILPSVMDEDVIIQIDDDELLRPLYIDRLKEVLAEHPDKYLFTAPYEKGGTVRITAEDPLRSWKKFSSMDRDVIRFYEESGSVKETIFGFGGNMVVRRAFAEQILYPLGIPRGEDFSMLLASRLVYENGNPSAGIEKGERLFRAFFLPYEEVTIIHRPPAEAKKDFLKYVENNMRRFVMEWGMFIKQEGLTIERLDDLSHYIGEMIGHEDMREYLQPIFDEMYGLYPTERIDEIRSDLYALVEHYIQSDRWEEYQKDQKEYIEMIRRLKSGAFRKLILERGRR